MRQIVYNIENTPKIVTFFSDADSWLNQPIDNLDSYVSYKDSYYLGKCLGNVLTIFIGLLGIKAGISTFKSVFEITAASGGASLALVTVSVEVALAGTAIASGSMVLAGTAFSNFGRDFNAFSDNKGLGNFIKIGDDVIELIGKNIVGTSYSKVKPTQDWIDMQQVNDYVKRLKMGEKLSPVEVYEVPGKGYFIQDGHHRFVASQMTGIPIEVKLLSGGGSVGLPDWTGVLP